MAEQQRSRTREILARLREGKIPAAKAEFDELLNEEVNLPLAEAGMDRLGSGLAAGASAVTDLIVPDSPGEAAMAVAGPLGRVASKGSKIARAAGKAAGEADELEDLMRAMRSFEKERSTVRKVPNVDIKWNDIERSRKGR